MQECNNVALEKYVMVFVFQTGLRISRMHISKRKPFQFLLTQIKTLLTITAISLFTVVFITIGTSSYQNRVKSQPFVLMGLTSDVIRWNGETHAQEANLTTTETMSAKNYTQKTKFSEPLLNESKEVISNEKCVKRLPQAIIAGIQKSGTTALLQFLSGHPQIAACLHPAETKYFSLHYNKPLSWYRNLMPCSFSNQITIEKSPPYFYNRFCAESIRKMSPNTKIIMIVKEPIARAISMYAMLNEQDRTFGMSFEDAVSFKTQSIINENSRLIYYSNYSKYMQAWLDNFKLNQILVLDGHNLEREPAQELNKVEHFLGISSYFTRDKFTFNSTKRKYCLLHEKGESECLGENKGRHHPIINNKMKGILENYFRPKNEQFFKMINRTFDWGY